MELVPFLVAEHSLIGKSWLDCLRYFRLIYCSLGCIISVLGLVSAELSTRHRRRAQGPPELRSLRGPAPAKN
jgi:hypothetical protein